MNTNAQGFHPTPTRDDKGRHVYCGPFALSTTTGASVEDVLRVVNGLRDQRPDKAVGTMWASEVRRALKDLGHKFTWDYWSRNDDLLTFTQWRKSEQVRGATYLLLITDHFIVVKGDWLTDTQHSQPHDLSRKPAFSRKRVRMAIKLA